MIVDHSNATSGPRAPQHIAAVEDELTVLITTSPTPSNPDLHLIEYVLKSFTSIPGLSRARKVIVCDGCKIRTRFRGDKSESLWRAGQVTQEALENYQQYVKALKDRVAGAHGDDAFSNSTVVALDERQGFGFAVKLGLSSIATRFVMVVQHDRNFTQAFDLSGLLDVMRKQSDEMKCVCLACASLLDYPHRIKSRFRVDITGHECRLKNGDRLVPLLQWLDSTHVAETRWYRDFVFDPSLKLVKKGGFIEDKFGQEQVKQIREKGFPYGWTVFKTWLYCEPYGTASGYVAHIDGRSLKEGSDIAKLHKP